MINNARAESDARSARSAEQVPGTGSDGDFEEKRESDGSTYDDDGFDVRREGKRERESI
jgi:hypothetical protein